MRARLSPLVESAAVVAALLAIAIAATYPLITHLGTHLPNDLGDPVLNASILAWDAAALARGGVHLFDAPNFFPYLHTLAYSDHLLGIALFTAPLQWLSGNAILVYNVAFIAAFVNAGAGMYLLARTLTGRRDAAFVAALVYAFSPFRVAHIAHVQWLMTGWLPFGLWALHRYMSTGALRFLLIAAIAYLLQSFTAMYFIYFGLLPLAVVAVAEAWRARPQLARTAGHVALAGALVAVALVPIVRVYSWVREDRGFARTPIEIQAYSADVSEYFRGHHLVRLWRHAPHGTGEHELFPGGIALVLAAIAIVTARGRSRSYVVLYAVITAMAFVLSLGPLPSAWGHHAPVAGPYRLLLSVVPGLDGLRAVARMAVIVLLGLSVLAAFGVVALLTPLSPRGRIVALAALAVAIVAESWAAPIPIARFDPFGGATDRQAYEFLRQSGSAAVVDLPLSLDRQERELRYQYLTLLHGRRTVNGSSSYDTTLHRFLGLSDQSSITDVAQMDVAAAFLRGMGVRDIVVHVRDFDRPADALAVLNGLSAAHRDVVARKEFGNTVVFVLAPDTTASHTERLRPVPVASIHATASDEEQRLPFLFDRDRDSRWLSGGKQIGTEWITLALDRPRDVALVRMQTAERSFGDYPRDLAIDVVEDGGTRTLFRGSVLPAFGRGLGVDYKYPAIDIALPANHARAVRLRQLGATDRMFWSIHELELWER